LGQINKNNGFTFVEVLATMVFMGIVIPAIMTGISLSLTAASMAKHQAEASALAHSKLMEIVSVGPPWRNVELKTSFNEDWPDYSWTASFSGWGNDNLLQQLDVVVYWEEKGFPRTVNMSTLVY